MKKHTMLRKLLAASISLSFIVQLAFPRLSFADTSGGAVAVGAGTLSADGLTYSSQNAANLLTYNTFNINANQAFNGTIPSGGVLACQVNGGLPSNIAGAVNVPGANFFFFNGAGVTVASGATFNTGATFISTLNIPTTDLSAYVNGTSPLNLFNPAYNSPNYIVNNSSYAFSDAVNVLGATNLLAGQSVFTGTLPFNVQVAPASSTIQTQTTLASATPTTASAGYPSVAGAAPMPTEPVSASPTGPAPVPSATDPGIFFGAPTPGAMAPYAPAPEMAAPQAPPPGFEPPANVPQAPPPGFEPPANVPQAPPPGFEPPANAPQAPPPGFEPPANAPQAPVPGEYINGPQGQSGQLGSNGPQGQFSGSKLSPGAVVSGNSITLPPGAAPPEGANIPAGTQVKINADGSTTYILPAGVNGGPSAPQAPAPQIEAPPIGPAPELNAPVGPSGPVPQVNAPAPLVPEDNK